MEKRISKMSSEEMRKVLTCICYVCNQMEYSVSQEKNDFLRGLNYGTNSLKRIILQYILEEKH